MEQVSASPEVVWDELQRVRGIQKRLEQHQWKTRFVVVLIAIVLTVAAATVLAHLGVNGAIRL